MRHKPQDTGTASCILCRPNNGRIYRCRKKRIFFQYKWRAKDTGTTPVYFALRKKWGGRPRTQRPYMSTRNPLPTRQYRHVSHPPPPGGEAPANPPPTRINRPIPAIPNGAL